ncbi:MAG: MarR family transcriptional regulator [Ekhidna sp.]|nr:MarR family transcriptional regulator [Ekhidna sp.]
MQKIRAYIYSILFEDFLGLSIQDFDLSISDGYLFIEKEGKKIVLRDDFFHALEEKYLDPESLPGQPLERLDFASHSIFRSLVHQTLPIIYGSTDISVDEDEIKLGLDIFGSCFFMLIRYEELVKTERDQHDRFPASASLAFQEGFLERPIVDEYVEVLWNCINFLWPDTKRVEKKFRVEVSCDVDWPYSSTFRSVKGIAKRSVGNLLKRRSISQFLKDLRRFGKVQSKGIRYDEFYQFPFIMDELEARDLKGTFYFIADNPAGEIDGIYSLQESEIGDLIREIIDRGHQVGLHPSYTTYQNRNQIALEKKKLEAQFQAINSHGKVELTRQHFLRFDASQTFTLLSESGFLQDSSMGYPDHIGFRAGTCKPYQMFDLKANKPLDIIQVPLLVMEVSMLSESYMGLSHDDALSRVSALVNQCRRYQGVFTFLWHNNQFYGDEDFKLYSNILDL